MKILVIGSGGREHALCWKLAQTKGVEVFATPGNPGAARTATCVPVLSSSRYVEIAEAVSADLTVVGPEAPLVAGVVDEFRAAGRLIVGPDAAAARLEGSKIFAKNFLIQSGIPTARFETVENEIQARMALKRFGYPVVLKADGLAAGKGVIIAQDPAEAEAALGTPSMLGTPGGGRLVIEEFLRGEEVSFIAVCDGKDAVALAPTQDHKAAFDGDQGPNTGGMGAYCDPAILTEAQTQAVLDGVIRPTVEAMKFTGFLYAGLMMTESGPKVLEFNVRLGDPEAQALLHRMRGDLAHVLLAAAEGRLDSTKLEWNAGPSVCVVMASGGYPGTYKTGEPIHGIQAAEALGATVFHAGTRLAAGRLETAGGRVLGVTAGGADLAGAVGEAYDAVRKIEFAGMHWRTDIGQKGIMRAGL